jgi:hypothetical protein
MSAVPFILVALTLGKYTRKETARFQHGTTQPICRQFFPCWLAGSFLLQRYSRKTAGI